MFFPSDWNIIAILFYSVFGVFAILLGFLDYFELLAMRYSKFRTEKGVLSRFGMFVLYFLRVIITATIFALHYLASASLTQWLVYAAILVHFGKRTYEVLFLHKYSGPMQPFTFVIIVITYALIAGLISALNVQAVATMDALFIVGIVFVVIGEIGNSIITNYWPICENRRRLSHSARRLV
ncbi:MAG: hypothetical protein L6461_12605 [Anaerolineae bacterium]|nr:hypothetical protein [Anaerolineae bacterium]